MILGKWNELSWKLEWTNFDLWSSLEDTVSLYDKIEGKVSINIY